MASATALHSRPIRDRLRSTGLERHTLVPRAVAGGALLMTGLAHVFVPEAPLRPLVEAAGFPLAAIASPIYVALKITVGVSLLFGLWARLAGLITIPMMLAAIYAHIVIDVWPSAPEVSEPPIALPAAVLASAAYLVWRGAGRWSLDRRAGTTA